MLRPVPELSNDLRDLAGFESPWDRDRLLALRSMDLFVDRKCRWCDREVTPEEIRMRHSPHMPELKEDLPPGAMDRAGHILPA
jgi:hypothetical protein